MTLFRASPVLLAFALAGCGGFGGPRPYSYTLKGLCESTPRQQFPAAIATAEVTLSKSTTLNLAPRIPTVEGETIEVFLDTITLTAQGVPNFDFIRALHVRARTPGTGALVDLARYLDDPSAAAPSPLVLTTVATGDLAGLLNNKVLAIDLEVTMTPPTVDWSIDMEGCFTIRASGMRDFFGSTGG